MGSLVSRRKRTVRAGAKSSSTRARQCGIRGSVITENPVEVEANASLVGRQKVAVTELKIGDGLMPDLENQQRQITTGEVAGNENQKRRLGLPKVKIRPRSGKKNPTLGKEFPTQYDFFGVPDQVQPPAENAKGDSKSQSLQADGSTDEASLAAAATAGDISHQESLKISKNIADDVGVKSCNKSQSRDYETLGKSSGGEKVNSTTLEKVTVPQLQQTSGSGENIGSVQRDTSGETRQSCYSPYGESRQSSHSPDMSESMFRSSGLPQREAVDDKAAGEPPKPVKSVNGQEAKVETLEDIFQENVPCRAELMEVAAVTGTGGPRRPLPPPAGYQACLNWEAITRWTGERELRSEAEKTDIGKTASAPDMSSQRVTLLDTPINRSQTKEGTEDEKDSRCLEEVIDEGKNVDTDGCQNEDIREDTLDWNVDDRVRSPSDPEKEADTDSDSCQEVIAEGFDHNNDDGQDDVMVESYCSGKGDSQEEHLDEDTLDINVDDRVYSPSDPRSTDHHSSDEEEDDTIDVLMNCAMSGEVTLVNRPQNSLTTPKDGDFADGSIYSPSNSLPKKPEELEEKENTVFEDLAETEPNQHQGKKRPMIQSVSVTTNGTIAKMCCSEEKTKTDDIYYLSGDTAKHGDRALPVGSENESVNSSQENIPSDSKDNVPLMETSGRIHDSSEDTTEKEGLQFEIGNTGDPPTGIGQPVSQPCNEGHIPLKETPDSPNTSGDDSKDNVPLMETSGRIHDSEDTTEKEGLQFEIGNTGDPPTGIGQPVSQPCNEGHIPLKETPDSPNTPGDDSKDNVPLMETSGRIHDSSEDTTEKEGLQFEIGNTGDLPTGIGQPVSQPCNEGHIPLKETPDSPNTPGDDSKDNVPLMETSGRIHDSSEDTTEKEGLQFEIGNTGDPPTGIGQPVSQPCNEGHILLKETYDSPNTSGDVRKIQKHENKAGKLLISDRTLSFGADESSKSILEMQEAEAMTLLLLTGTLPCENNGDVIRGAGDGRNLDVNGVDITDENHDADERAGLAAMLDNNSKSSCQLEQLQIEHSQVENPNNIVGVRPPQNSQLADNDTSAACTPAEHHPQVDPNQEPHSNSVRGNNTPVMSQHTTHGAAAASFVEESMNDNLPSFQRPVSPGAAAASEVAWETTLQHRVGGQTNLGGSAACAPSTSSKFYANCTQEIPNNQHSNFGHETEPNTQIIEVQAASTTGTVAQCAEITGTLVQSLPDESLQQDDNGQASNTSAVGHPEQNQLLSDSECTGVFTTHDSGKSEPLEGNSDEMKPNIQELNEREGTANSPRQRRTVVVPTRLPVSNVSVEPDQGQMTNSQLTESSTLKTYPAPFQNDDKASQE